MTASPDNGAPVQDATQEPSKGDSQQSYFAKLVVGLGALGTVGIFLLMVLIDTDVISRALFDAPVPGVPEIVQIMVVAIVFLQVTQSLAGGRFTRSPVIHSIIVARSPHLGRVLGMLFHLTGAALMGLILAGEIPRFIDAVVQGQYFGHRGVFVVPRWPLDLTVALGSLVCAMQFLLMAWRELRGTGGNAATPI
jgi:TRAP-type mannitol/chloroaromatic compound transport system permease small subunit